MNVNKVFLGGRLTRDPELTYLPSNTPVVALGLAVNRAYTKADGEKCEEVLFVDASAFGKTAEAMAKWLHKGREVFIEGRLKLDQWQDKDGGKRQKIKVIVDNFQFVGAPDQQGGGDQAEEAPQPTGRSFTAKQADESYAGMGSEEDIPF